MAGPPSVAGAIWQVRMIGELDGQQIVNVLHFQTPGSVDDMELRLIVVLANCWLTHLKPVTASGFTLNEIRYQLMSANPPGLEYTYAVPGGTATGSAAALPSFNAAVVSLRSNIGGRHGRGRMFLAGIPEAATTNSLLDTGHAYWAGLIAFCACVAAAFINEGSPPANFVRWIIYSRSLGGASVPFSIAGATHTITATPNALIGTIRSRKVGRGA